MFCANLNADRRWNTAESANIDWCISSRFGSQNVGSVFFKFYVMERIVGSIFIACLGLFFHAVSCGMQRTKWIGFTEKTQPHYSSGNEIILITCNYTIQWIQLCLHTMVFNFQFFNGWEMSFWCFTVYLQCIFVRS